jgi:hypothetical protein
MASLKLNRRQRRAQESHQQSTRKLVQRCLRMGQSLTSSKLAADMIDAGAIHLRARGEINALEQKAAHAGAKQIREMSGTGQ